MFDIIIRGVIRDAKSVVRGLLIVLLVPLTTPHLWHHNRLISMKSGAGSKEERREKIEWECRDFVPVLNGFNFFRYIIQPTNMRALAWIRNKCMKDRH